MTLRGALLRHMQRHHAGCGSYMAVGRSREGGGGCRGGGGGGVKNTFSDESSQHESKTRAWPAVLWVRKGAMRSS